MLSGKWSRRVASYQAALTKARAEVERERERSNGLQRELAHATRVDRNSHHCPTQEQVQAAMRSRDDAFRALVEVEERHTARDAKFCRCGQPSADCADQQLVAHYPAYKKWKEDNRVN